MRTSRLDLTAYSVADYADKPNDSRSVSGAAITLRDAAVSWAVEGRCGIPMFKYSVTAIRFKALLTLFMGVSFVGGPMLCRRHLHYCL